MNIEEILTIVTFGISILLISLPVSIPFIKKIRNKENFIYYIFIFNIIMDAFGTYSEKGSIFAITRAFTLYSFFLYIFLKKSNFFAPNIPLLITLLYFLFLISFSSELFDSFRIFLSVSISILMYLVGYHVIKDIKQLEKLNNSIIWVMVIIISYFVLSNIFGLGDNIYMEGGEDAVSTGFGGSNLYIGSISILLLPIIFPFLNKRKKILVTIFSIMVFIILLLSLRRATIIIIIVGYFVYSLFSSYKKKTVSYILGLLLSLILLYPFYGDTLEKRLDLRKKDFHKNSIENELRYLETIIIYDHLFSFNKLIETIFGKELFNSPNNWYGPRDRQLHIDYNVILHGSGVLGFILYSLFHFKILFTFLRVRETRHPAIIQNELAAMFFGLYSAMVIIAIIGGMHVISFRTAFFMYLGGITSILKGMKNAEYLPGR